MSYKFNMHTPTNFANLSVFKITAHFMTIGVWTFLEGFWLVYIYTLALAIKNKTLFYSILIIIILFIFTIVSGCVFDITRSGSYMVPIIFIFMIYLHYYLHQNLIRMLLLASFIISFLFPALVICSDWPLKYSLQDSIFIRILRHFIDFLIHHKLIGI